jgi:hypothetical protein
MPKQDLHSKAIPEEILEQVRSKLREVSELLDPYATALTASERHDLPKMGEKSLSFGEKARELAVENPDLCPPYLDVEAFNVDMADATGLRVVRNNASQALETIDDIALLSGSEAYQAALAFYNYVRLLASRDVPRAKAVYEELKKRFPRVPKRKGNADNV